MKAQMLMAALFGVLAAGTSLSGERVLPSSLELEKRTQPWCPDDCAVVVPFVATYQRGKEALVFVGARHAFDPDDPTMRAVEEAFSGFTPAVVILEAFPTSMGENPPPLVELARSHGTPEASGFARGEAMYAASLALARSVPFLGGEPTLKEQLDGLRAEGFTDADLAFSSVLGWFSQSLRSKEVRDTSRGLQMDVIIERCAGLDVHRDTVVACAQAGGACSAATGASRKSAAGTL